MAYSTKNFVNLINDSVDFINERDGNVLIDELVLFLANKKRIPPSVLTAFNCDDEKEVIKGAIMKNNSILFDDTSIFSSIYKCKFTVEDLEYESVDEYIISEKEKFLESGQACHSQAIENNDHIDNEEEWQKDYLMNVLMAANLAKFKQNGKLLQKLMSTENYNIIYCNTEHTILGNGIKKENVNDQNPLDMKGYNLLGKALMTTRSVLRGY